jgi:hypothetical protein
VKTAIKLPAICSLNLPTCSKLGHCYREFALNEDIDELKIRATLRNGVLELELPKKEHARPRRIEVRSAEEQKTENLLGGSL